MLRVGFLGAGLIANYHAVMLASSGVDFERASVFDPDPGRTASFAQHWGFRPARSEEEVLDDCDAVYVCTWTAAHPDLVAAAAARGLAIFCEKPLGVDLATARAVAASLESAPVHQVGLVLRRAPSTVLLRALALDLEAAGRIMAVVFRDDQFIPVRGMYASTWRGDPALAGSGTLLEHSIHDLDLLAWIAGPVRSASCRTASFHGIEGIEDAASALLAHEDGTSSTLTSVWHDVDERPSLRRIEVLCERRWIALEGDHEGPVRWRTAGDASDTVVAGESMADAARELGGILANPDGSFLRAVRDGRPAWPTAADALAAHEVADACYRSAAAGGALVPVGVSP